MLRPRTASRRRRSASRARPTCAPTTRSRGSLDELDGWARARRRAVAPEDVLAALERAEVRLGAAGEPGPRRRPRPDARARTRRFEVVFVLGLEEGTLPRRGHASPFLDDDARGDARRAPRARLVRPDPVERDRYLFYTACTRATRRLYLVREAATDEGSPREPSPFWEEVAALFDPDDVRALDEAAAALGSSPGRSRRRRPSASGCARSPLLADDRARRRRGARRRERLGAAARRALARVRRARRGSRTRSCSRELARAATFNVTELERFADCSSAWFVERVDRPAPIDARGRREAARLGRAHGAVPLLRRPAEGARQRARRREPPRRRRSCSSASASTARSTACGWR